MILLSLISSFAAILILIAALFFLFIVLQGAPYVPTTEKRVEIILELADIRPNERAVDLGSGDGRIVIALARAGAEAHGYEINPFLVWKARRAIRHRGLEGCAFIHWGSFWRQPLGGFRVVIVYGMTRMMPALQKKLTAELSSGARVISNAFIFPKWEYFKKEDKLYLYEVS